MDKWKSGGGEDAIAMYKTRRIQSVQDWIPEQDKKSEIKQTPTGGL